MATGIVFTVVEGMLGKLVDLVGQGIGLIWDVEGELEKLRETVSTIKDVLLDAEEPQAQNQTLGNWLEKLKDVVDDADDLVDDFSTDALRGEVMGQNRMAKKVRIFFSESNQLLYRFKSSREIKAIRERLVAIAADRAQFNFDVRHREKEVRYRARDHTHSFVLEEEVIGREDDKEAIIELLLDSNVKENVAILPIIGIGGLGKTTLAQLVFNDEAIKKHFEKKMWVCVSDNYDVKVIVEKILESVTKEKPENFQMDTLVENLQKEINRSRYLLVLDDVWEDNLEKWLSLRRLLMGGARGSRILITTRIKGVAKITKTIQPFCLKGLDELASWSLFKQMAFESGEEPNNSKFVAIGKEILEKCAGVPLAIRTIGRLLRLKDSEREWLSFKSHEIWSIPQNDENDILPTLKLSYDHLPSHLKHCFAFCRLFPKDYEIEIPNLINLWMAQGFINLSDHNQCLEDVGLDYFMDLLWRSFFQEVKKDKWGNVKYCKMHDLMHDLAIKVAGKESITLDSNTENVDEKTRHVSFETYFEPSSQIPTPLFKASRLRTFLLQHNELSPHNQLPRFRWKQSITDKSTFDVIVSSFRFLRVLQWHRIGFSIVPDSFSKLKHLRYLDLSYNKFEMLPYSFSELLNLQTLRLSWCGRLKAWPKDIYKLVNLRCLEINNCDALTYMPSGLGELANLRTLSQFVVAGKDNSVFESGLKELHGLNKLRGELEIIFRKGEEFSLESKAANLKEKEHLQALTISWENEGIIVKNVGYDYEMFLEGFEPHPNLQNLSIKGYKGVRFPEWLSSLSNLVDLSLYYCTECQYLPPLDQVFPSLKTLKIEKLYSLEYISISEESGNTSSGDLSVSSFFPSLEQLKLRNCPNLKGWRRKRDSVEVEEHHLLPLPSFPRLSSLSIDNCNMLTSMPLFPYLKESLDLRNSSIKPLQQTMMMKTKNKETSLKSPTSTKTLAPSTSSSSSTIVASSFAPLSNLKSLCVEFCEELQSLPEDCLQNLTSLEVLIIHSCPKVTSLSQGIQHLTALKKLHIGYCEEFELSNDGDGMQWQGLRSLRTLTLHELPKLVSLPVGLQHATTLQQLQISSCDNLMAIQDWIRNLSSLQRLHIQKCPNLTSLPQGMRDLTSLQSLYIDYCPILSQRCKRETGEDWPNISHIPNLEVDQLPR